jgi:hypothetical protein
MSLPGQLTCVHNIYFRVCTSYPSLACSHSIIVYRESSIHLDAILFDSPPPMAYHRNKGRIYSSIQVVKYMSDNIGEFSQD